MGRSLYPVWIMGGEWNRLDTLLRWKSAIFTPSEAVCFSMVYDSEGRLSDYLRRYMCTDTIANCDYRSLLWAHVPNGNARSLSGRTSVLKTIRLQYHFPNILSHQSRLVFLSCSNRFLLTCFFLLSPPSTLNPLLTSHIPSCT